MFLEVTILEIMGHKFSVVKKNIKKNQYISRKGVFYFLVSDFVD